MRWRIAIAVLAGIGIAGAVYVSTQPKKGTVEYHKRGYVRSDAILKAAEPTLATRVANEFTQQTLSELMLEELKRFEYHQKALISLGFLERREYGLYSFPLGTYEEQLATGLRQIRQAKREFTETFCERRSESNLVVVVIGLPADMPKWEKLVRKGDAPATK